MGDIYQIFYERGCQLLRPGHGILAYITSNSWLKAQYGKSLRRYFTENHTPLLLLELGKDVFESAIVDSCVMMLCAGGDAHPFPAVDMDRVKSADFPPHSTLWEQVKPNGDASWSAISLAKQRVLDKICQIGTPLKKWDVSIHVGTITGFNEAFVISSARRAELIASDPKSADIIKPVLRGRDIQRYRSKWAGKWLIDTHNGYDDVAAVNIDDYPAIKAHLDQFYTQLQKRSDKGRTPYNLRSCAFHEEFAKEKLLWIELVENGRFAYDNSGIYGEATTYIMTGTSLKYLCAVLNASLTRWFLQQMAPTSGMGTLRWKKGYVENIPIPKNNAAKQRPFIRLVDQILATKNANPDAHTSNLELEIDRLVYNIYDLTEEERTAIERSLGLIHATDEEEDAALVRALQDESGTGTATRGEVLEILRAPNGG